MLAPKESMELDAFNCKPRKKKMSVSYAYSILVLGFFLCFSFSSPTSYQDYQSFVNCFSTQTQSSNFSRLLHTPNTSSFYNVFNSSIKNLLFVFQASVRPFIIITPTSESEVQASIICCRSQNFQIRARSGGHDYEGLSYRSANNHPFVILDLAGLRSVEIDAEHGTAWVQSGATLGELYYRIAEKSRLFGFPAGICPTVGVGGHLSGGGFGNMLRKYGLAADNVLDAKLVDANGRLLDKEAMGKDLFWAIRGGGGTSFGVIISWKIKLVLVPAIVTVFSIHKTLAQGATKLVSRWQYIAHKLHEDLFIRVVIQKAKEREAEALFNSLYLGGCQELVLLMNKSFPELGFGSSACKEMSWIQSVMYFAGYTNGEPLELLLQRMTKPERYFKATSDYVVEPIAEFNWERVWDRVLEERAGLLILDPYGGRMAESPASATPFPHRKGNMYNIQYFVEWRESGEEEAEKHVGWIKSIYEEMAPYVSRNPRGAYVNYRDLDYGVNEEQNGITSYSKAKVWGVKYFNGNFESLARVKGRVDPSDFFRNEQSIPPLLMESEELEDALNLSSM